MKFRRWIWRAPKSCASASRTHSARALSRADVEAACAGTTIVEPATSAEANKTMRNMSLLSEEPEGLNPYVVTHPSRCYRLNSHRKIRVHWAHAGAIGRHRA